jgi:hypothetical protein
MKNKDENRLVAVTWLKAHRNPPKPTETAETCHQCHQQLPKVKIMPNRQGMEQR